MREDHSNRVPGLPTLGSHTAVHQTLLPYSSLLHWMRQTEPQPFNDIMEVGMTSHDIMSVCLCIT